MNKKALYGILLALIVPLTAYFILKAIPTVAPPPRVFFDSVVIKISHGKEMSDTVWNHVPDFLLINQLGQKVSWKDMMYQKNDSTIEGKIVVVDFFFTRCPSICPAMAQNMKLLQDGIKNLDESGKHEADFVQFISVSVDPENDSVAELKKWANFRDFFSDEIKKARK